jgi:hypothetical protein
VHEGEKIYRRKGLGFLYGTDSKIYGTVPQHLLGIVLESQGHHPDAMRHFRAAWSLDPTFLPASQNIDAYSLYDSEKDVKPAYTVDDCLPERQPTLLEKSVFFLRRLWTGKRKVQAA